MNASAPEVLRVAVAGAGRMGARHIRTFNALAGVEVSVIYDPRPASECDLSDVMQGRCTQSYQAFLEQARRADMAVIAGPTATHFGVTRDLIGCGLSCLVEKPMTVRPRECLMLGDLARAHGTGLYCAHIERFNSALQATAGLLRNHPWEEVNITRHNPDSARLSGDSIVTDLMIHDLDIVQHVMGLTFDALLDVESGADGLDLSAGEGADHVAVRLQTDAGYPVTLSTGRLPDSRQRAIHARSAKGSLYVDLLNGGHDLQFATPDLPAAPEDSNDSNDSDALTRQAQAMVCSVMDGQSHGLASAEQSWQTLTLCQLIEQRLRLAS
ncbi:Gfo/Idh/MocA family protein [Kushneria phyllosphaerae]|uniref:Inositol 2-dehydrogenase/D-chiro-inositol 3-dehydrogenase n=1 Tax=Kushneria phyllosphaerae TaxID=2100822 RepID=A0A2R8CJ39_9GAMM|nr:Gfo/Idh/MocA family oxidoreductase [Kushneria phyllosphaerae]SPJ32905.1 Inositol 2-dehydrogenase/D-chiro-inositol 3-dehydrogenase [Kushneria phyllosphaerae]